MKWIEANPLPSECQNCQEEECYNCDHAGKRWKLAQEDALRIRRKGLAKAMERLQKQIDEIDEILMPFTKQQQAALDGSIKMTCDLFLECLEVCFRRGDRAKFYEIWKQYPVFIVEAKRRANKEPNRSISRIRWRNLKRKLRKELGADWVKENCID